MTLPDDFSFMFIKSMNYGNTHHTLLRDNEKGVQLEKVSDGNKRCSRSFFIDGDDREFKTIETLTDAYNEKYKFEEENPEYEVKHVRVVVKRGSNPTVLVMPESAAKIPNHDTSTESSRNDS